MHKHPSTTPPWLVNESVSLPGGLISCRWAGGLPHPVELDQQEVHPGNNVIERLQQTLRATTKRMRGFDSLKTAQEQINGFRAYHNHVLPQPRLGGMTPAEAAGVPTPILANEGRLMAVLAAAHDLQVQMAKRNGGRVPESTATGESQLSA